MSGILEVRTKDGLVRDELRVEHIQSLLFSSVLRQGHKLVQPTIDNCLCFSSESDPNLGRFSSGHSLIGGCSFLEHKFLRGLSTCFRHFCLEGSTGVPSGGRSVRRRLSAFLTSREWTVQKKLSEDDFKRHDDDPS